jgi:hypothetical protein
LILGQRARRRSIATRLGPARRRLRRVALPSCRPLRKPVTERRTARPRHRDRARLAPGPSKLPARSAAARNDDRRARGSSTSTCGAPEVHRKPACAATSSTSPRRTEAPSGRRARSPTAGPSRTTTDSRAVSRAGRKRLVLRRRAAHRVGIVRRRGSPQVAMCRSTERTLRLRAAASRTTTTCGSEPGLRGAPAGRWSTRIWTPGQ